MGIHRFLIDFVPHTLFEAEQNLSLLESFSFSHALKIFQKGPMQGADTIFFLAKNNTYLFDVVKYLKEQEKQENGEQTFFVFTPFSIFEKLSPEDKVFFHTVSNVFFVKHFSAFVVGLSKFLSEKASSPFFEAKIHPTALMGQNVSLGKNVVLFPGVCLMNNVSVEDNVILYPNVIVYSNTTIGANSIIHAGSVIGADGFGYEFIEGKYQKIYHTGGVSIGPYVEIGANTTIDRGTFSMTSIGEGSKIDNAVHIGHNCCIGKHVILCGQVGLSGSVTLGDYCVLGGNVKVAPGVTLGDYCEVAGNSAVSKDWPKASQISGYPAIEIKQWLREISFLRKNTAVKTKI